MPDNNITVSQAAALVDEFKSLNISSQYSSFIPKAQIEELLSQSGSIGLNIYNGYADGKIHLVVVSAQTSTDPAYQIQDDLSIVKNGYDGSPQMTVVPNDINT